MVDPPDEQDSIVVEDLEGDSVAAPTGDPPASELGLGLLGESMGMVGSVPVVSSTTAAATFSGSRSSDRTAAEENSTRHSVPGSVTGW